MLEILDLYCGVGGAAMGYHQALEAAGIPHHITGVDINPQPRYPFTFVQHDALSFPLTGYDFIHASPPCQAYSWAAKQWNRNYMDLLAPTRTMLEWERELVGTFYVIENVIGAPVLQTKSIRLCGSSFGLKVLRHRWFEFPDRPAPIPEPRCNHVGSVPTGEYVTVAGHGGNGRRAHHVWCEAMQMDWATNAELAQAIPPAYTRYIMQQLLQKGILSVRQD